MTYVYPNQRAKLVRDAHRRLHVATCMARRPDGGYDPEWQPELMKLAQNAVYSAARLAGEDPDDATCFADQPDGDHPYNIKRITIAVGMFPKRGAFYQIWE